MEVEGLRAAVVAVDAHLLRVAGLAAARVGGWVASGTSAPSGKLVFMRPAASPGWQAVQRAVAVLPSWQPLQLAMSGRSARVIMPTSFFSGSPWQLVQLPLCSEWENLRLGAGTITAGAGPSPV